MKKIELNRMFEILSTLYLKFFLLECKFAVSSAISNDRKFVWKKEKYLQHFEKI